MKYQHIPRLLRLPALLVGLALSAASPALADLIDTTTTVTIVPASPVYGQVVTVEAKVQGSSGNPTAGLVNFTGAGLNISMPLDAAGTVIFTTTELETGTIMATFTGSGDFSPSTGTLGVIISPADTTTALSADISPSVFGQTVTFTATVTATPPGASVPTGTVAFFDGANMIGDAPLDGTGQAVFPISDLNVDSHAIMAVYSGAPGMFFTSANTLSHTVIEAATNVTVDVIPEPSTFGDEVTVYATVTTLAPGDGTPTGTVTFTGAGLNQTVALDGAGQAGVMTSSLISGTITAIYSGDAGHAASTGTASVTVIPASTTVTVTATPDPSVFGEYVTIVATVEPEKPGIPPTGSVTFTGPGGFGDTVDLDSNGEAVLGTSALTSGTITAVYSGDDNYSGSAGATNVTVSAAATTTTIGVAPNPSVFGQLVEITALVFVDPPGSGTPTGSVTFTLPNGSNQIVPLDAAGSATMTTDQLSSGTVTATYAGDAGYSGSMGTSDVTVDPASTETVVTATPNPSVYGEAVTVSATVTTVAPGSGTPTGTVTFTGPGGFNETVPLDASGVAAFTWDQLTSGTITATYHGDSGRTGSTGTLALTVNPASTQTVVTATPNPSVYGEEVTVFVTVTTVAPGSGTPTGTVTFTGPGGLNQMLTLDGNGEAALTTTSLTSGTITASYNGAIGFSASVGTETMTVNPAATTTTVSVAPDPSESGQSVLVSAVVSVEAPGSGIATGSVTFTLPNGSTQTVPLDALGVAAFTTSQLTSGTVTATYAGDDGFLGSAGTAGVTVNPASTQTSVLATLNPSVYGQAVTISAAVTVVAPGSGTPTGSVTFSGSGGLNQTVTLDAAGVAAFTSDQLTTGTITATYHGDSDYSSSVGTVDVTVDPASTETVVTATPNPSVYGEAVTVSATVTTVAPGSGTPTGTVTFTGPGGFNETVPLDGSGVAAFTWDQLTSGTITATYHGDSGRTGSTGTLALTVNPASTQTVVTATPNPSVYGEAVTVSAAVTTVAPGSGTPTGTVTFTGPGGLNQTVPLDGSGVAALTTTTLTAGIVAAVYNGDSGHITSVGTIAITVNPASTQTVVTATPNPSTYGQAVEVAATVTMVAPGSGTPTGTVTFTGPGGLDTTVALDAAGQAVLTTTTLTSGTITASYNGAAASLASSGTVTVTVSQVPTTTTVVSSSTPATYGGDVTFTASVTSTASGTPTGTITFTFDGAAPVSVALDGNGQASATNSALTAGSHAISATYSGDATFAASTGTFSQTISPASATIALSGLQHTYDGSAKSASATTTPAGLSVTLNYNGGANAPTNAGSYEVSAAIEDLNYTGSTTGTLTIAKASQTISFTPPANIEIDEAVTLSAKASSGLLVAYSIVSGNATLDGDTLTAHGPGVVVIRIDQAGDENHEPVSVEHTFGDVAKLPQTIAFAPLDDREATAAPFELTASASSGLPVSFAITSGPAIVSGNTVTLTGAPGVVVVTATQAGDNKYAAAPAVSQSFEVTQAGPLVYFGQTSDGTEFAVAIPEGSTAGMLFGEIAATGQYYLLTFRVNEDRSVTATSITILGGSRAGNADPSQPPRAAATEISATLTGRLEGTRFIATIPEFGITLEAEVEPSNGPAADMAGVYESASINSASGSTTSIVGTSGKVYVLVSSPDIVTGGMGTISEDGEFALELPGSVIVAGNVDAPTSTVSGTIVLPNGEETDFAGRGATTLRTDRLINLSSRARIDSTAGRTLITGFVIGGTETKRVLLRAAGPALAEFGVVDALSNPRLQLYRGSEIVLENDDWSGTGTADAFSRVGAFGFQAGSRDAAILATLEPGAYTMHVIDGGTSGVALAEIYDASDNPQGEHQRLINISSRGLVDGSSVLIGGFVVTGNTPKKVLIRGVGQGLAQFGLTDILSDPQLAIYSGTEVIARNDNWSVPQPINATQVAATGAEIAAAAEAIGAFGLDTGSNDAAILVTLAPGAYTAQVTGANSASGVALVEIYELQD